MIKVNYIKPNDNESLEDIARSNIIISDKFKKSDYLELSCIAWLKLDSQRNYQDLERLLRSLNLISHVIAYPKGDIPEDIEINLPNENINENSLDYVIKIICKSHDEALEELLKYHLNYEENFNCLKNSGCLMTKKKDCISEINKNLNNLQDVEEIKKILSCELKLDFKFFKTSESINIIIENLIKEYSKKPEKIICGEVNQNKVYALMIDNKIVSPIGWIEKEKEIDNKIIDIDNNLINNKFDIELIDFRTIKIDKN